jgi:alkylated DNA repair dioxygenase AlkB
VVDLLLKDGDLVVMGGACQKTHKHEVPALRKTKDPPSANRINWTVRAFA